MCGIAGALAPDLRREELTSLGHAMAATMVHRGPDDGGVWCEDGIVLSHRRLAVIDLSADGHQPMESRSGRYVLVFNGEIYNFAALRNMLEREHVQFRGASDTEVLLEAIDHWGLETALVAANGMFAIGLWDRRERVLALARDRVGEKPLYFGTGAGVVAFASELKALRRAGIGGTVDPDGLRDLLGLGYVRGDATIVQGVEKVRPGEIVELDSAGALLGRRRYWEPSRGPWSTAPREQLLAELEDRVRDAVALRMVADVPVGAFLSGGIDSSLVVATMQELSTKPVSTFTVGFDERAYDEAPFAREIARHLGTDHHEIYVSPQDSLDVIPRLPDIYDEPFADVSQIPTVLISALARSHVTVSLSGDGGDELFGGYERYARALQISSRLGRLPRSVRHLSGRRLEGMGPVGTALLAAPAYRAVLRRRPPPDLAHKVRRLGQLLGAEGEKQLYDGLMRHWSDPEEVVVGASRGPDYGADTEEVHDFVDWMMRADMNTYLPDDILVKVDRAAMSVSLETRVPLLDPELVDFALRLPSGMRRSLRGGKELLRDLLARSVPRDLFERPKMGFGVPLDQWLRGALRPWAEDLLDPSRLQREGHLHPDVVARVWGEHLSGARDWQYQLWDVLMFQAWLDRWQRAPVA